MSEIAVVRPRKQSAISLYSKLYYKERLKSCFDHVWERAQETLAPASRISMCQQFIQASWSQESEEFRKGLEDRAAQEHAEAMAVYQKKDKWDGSAEAYQQYVMYFILKLVS